MPWYQSKTVWMNVIAALVVVGQVWLDRGAVSGEWAAGLAALVAVLNLLLRLLDGERPALYPSARAAKAARATKGRRPTSRGDSGLVG